MTFEAILIALIGLLDWKPIIDWFLVPLTWLFLWAN